MDFKKVCICDGGFCVCVCVCGLQAFVKVLSTCMKEVKFHSNHISGSITLIWLKHLSPSLAVIFLLLCM